MKKIFAAMILIFAVAGCDPVNNPAQIRNIEMKSATMSCVKQGGRLATFQNTMAGVSFTCSYPQEQNGNN